jgi:hypothetical protein
MMRSAAIGEDVGYKMGPSGKTLYMYPPKDLAEAMRRRAHLSQPRDRFIRTLGFYRIYPSWKAATLWAVEGVANAGTPYYDKDKDWNP